MFGTPFYHKRVRKSVALFGALFNNLYVTRTDAAGKVLSQEKVPLSYAPKRKFIERLTEHGDLENDTQVAVKLPRMSFELTSLAYASERQVTKTQKIIRNSSGDTRTLLYNGVPYNLFFQLNIYAKNQDECLQILEQIIPYFAPQYTITIKPFDDYPEIKEDVPITIMATSFQDDFEGTMEQRRTILYTIDFELKANFYGPIGDRAVIREVKNNFYLMGDSDTPVSRFVLTPDPIDVSPDSDYGFTEIWTDFIG